MKKYIIREVPAEQACLRFYFDDDGFGQNGGDYKNTLFIIHQGRYGLNSREFEKVYNDATDLIDDVCAMKNGSDKFRNYKDLLYYYAIDYSPPKCGKIKKWAFALDGCYWDLPQSKIVADYLSFREGGKWTTGSARGYGQGDYVDLVYCEGHHTEKGAQAAGEVWLGAAKEFCTICIDESGNETDTCYGFIVADCEAFTDEEYKKLICEWDCLPEEETELQMIEGYSYNTTYSYRTA